MTQVVIISVPYTEPVPLVAPALLSACLNNNGISAVGLDFSAEFLNEFLNKDYWSNLKNLITLGLSPSPLPRYALKDIFKFIRKKLKHIKTNYNPEYLGLSIFTHESINFSYILIPFVRKYLPNTKIIVGGRGLELMCNTENRLHYLKYFDHGLADICVVGDAETAIVDVIQNKLYGIYHAKQQTKNDLDNIPVPDWSNYNFEIYQNFEEYEIAEAHDMPGEDRRYFTITGSKGCVRKCTFCDVASFWPNYIYRDGIKIAQEIISMYNNTGMKNYRFTDNLMNGSISHYRKMNEHISEIIPNTINYKGFAIFRQKSQMPEEDFYLAKRAGCSLWNIGVESGSEKIRNDMKKHFNNEDLDFGVINLHKNDIVQGWLLMVGYPTETEQDYLDTEDLLKRHAYLNKNTMIRLSVTPTFMILQGSPLVTDENINQKYKLNHNFSDGHLSQFFWTTETNIGNTFDTRYNRWLRLVNLAIKLNYTWLDHVRINKWKDELQDLKKIYDESKPKKVFAISANKRYN